MSTKRLTSLLCTLFVVILCLPSAAFGDYLKMAEPPDVDKDAYDLTCWLATAANMLAGAGYGYSMDTSVQARADSIYNQLKLHFGIHH